LGVVASAGTLPLLLAAPRACELRGFALAAARFASTALSLALWAGAFAGVLPPRSIIAAESSPDGVLESRWWIVYANSANAAAATRTNTRGS
jgi:hypothetical protein